MDRTEQRRRPSFTVLLAYGLMSLVLLSFIVLSPTIGVAGTGKLVNGKFNISISGRFVDASGNAISVPNQTISDLQTWFQGASEVLFDATDGNHQFGTIRFCNNGRGGVNADVYFVNQAWLSSNFPGKLHSFVGRECVIDPVTGRPGIGDTTKSCQVKLFDQDLLITGAPGSGTDGRHAIAHEFSHYAYGILDEYLGANNSAGQSCVDVTAHPGDQASLMEDFWQKPTSEFCVADDHDPDHGNLQSLLRGESGWETIVRFYPGITPPPGYNIKGVGAGYPSTGPTTGATPPVWEILQSETRMVLTLDKSDSMNFPPDKIATARDAAKKFTDLVVPGDKLAVVAFNDVATTVFPMTTITSSGAEQAAAKTAINGITASGLTTIGGALREALNQIVAAGPQACQETIVLISDGIQTSGEGPDTVLPDLKARGVVVHTVALGPDADQALLSSIASQTNGIFEFAASSADLQRIFTDLKGKATDNGGSISSAFLPVPPGSVTDTTVVIDPFTPEAQFVISWPGTAEVHLTLVQPNGVLITPASPGIVFSSDSNHEIYTIQAPQAGQWTMRITAVGQADVTAQALGSSATVSFVAKPSKESFTFPEPILIKGTPFAVSNIVGASVTGTVARPDGSVVPIALFDDGNPGHGDGQGSDGVYSNFFQSINQNGTYTFRIVASTANAFLFSGEGVFRDNPATQPISPEGASTVPAPAFTREQSFSVQLAGVPPAIVGSFFLHGNGPATNPTTLFLDRATPTATAAKSQDSPAINFNGGNPWQKVGVWSAAPTLTSGLLANLTPLQVWLGLKNSDDQGTQFDVRAEILSNGDVVAAGETRCVTNVTRNPSSAKLVSVPFSQLIADAFDGASDVLSLRILTRIGTNPDGTKCPGPGGSHNNAVGLRVYFDAVSRNAGFAPTP